MRVVIVIGVEVGTAISVLFIVAAGVLVISRVAVDVSNGVLCTSVDSGVRGVLGGHGLCDFGVFVNVD
jgi:hypothetical protein